MDRTGKLLLAAIALGVWAHVSLSMVHSVALKSQASTLASIDNRLNTIEQIHLKAINNTLVDIGNGACVNKAICKP